MRYLLLLITFFTLGVRAQPSLKPDKLTCEYTHNPLGIDVAGPRLSWTLFSNLRNEKQLAYEILVSDVSPEDKQGTVWESGKISSSQNTQIVYKGKPLKPFTRYYWKVRVYDLHNRPSAWSKVAWFETAALSNPDWKGSWISDGKKQFEKDEEFYNDDPMPLFKKQVSINKTVVSARLYISGIGYYEAYINGKKVGNNVLDPGFTKYSKQVLYSTYDVTSYFRSGNNQLGVMLGNGWYNPLPLRLFGSYNLRDFQQTGRPCLKAQVIIKYSDGSADLVKTDSSWKTHTGPIIRNNVFLGEQYDARLEAADFFSDTADNWKNAVEVNGPSGMLSAQAQPPVQVIERITPKSITQISRDTFIVDMGQNFAGTAHIKVKGQAGTTVRLKYGEDLYPNGRLNYMTTVAGHIKEIWNLKGGPGAPKTAWQEDVYTLKGGDTESWCPRFTFHGFRYIQVTGWPGVPGLTDIEGLKMSAILEDNGTFLSSNRMFNQLDTVINRTFLSNVFSIQSDCPGREKMGYGADIVTTSPAYIQNFNMANFYTKTVRDFANDQQEDGGITEIAPFTGIAVSGPGGLAGPLGWQLAFSDTQKKLYDYYGDKRIIETYYPNFVKQLTFLEHKAQDNLFFKDISDHASIDPKPEAFTASAFYYHHVMLAAEFAQILNKKQDQARYTALALKIKEAIVKKYYDAESGKFDNGTQAAQLFGLWYGFSPNKKASLDVLMKDYQKHGFHLTTGIFATQMLFNVLPDNGYADIAYRIADQRDYPGWGYMLGKGATTLWESWDYPDQSSQNHPMFGSISEWFYRGLLGINPALPGYKKIKIKPQVMNGLKWAKGSYQSVMGNIVSEWQTDGRLFNLHVNVPANTTAEIWVPCVPGGKVKEGTSQLTKNGSIKLLRYSDGYAVIQTGSGDYRFSTVIK